MHRKGFLHRAPFLGQPVAARPVSLGRPAPRRRLGAADSANLMELLRKHGAILPVQIGIPAAMAEQLKSKGETPPIAEEISALIDTGASITAINVAAAQRIGLPVTGSVQIAGATGVSQQPMYGAMVRFTDPDIEYGAMQIGGANLNAPDFEMLIGRDILCHLHLAYAGPKGQFSLLV